MAESVPCPECGAFPMVQRSSGFLSCTVCGKLALGLADTADESPEVRRVQIGDDEIVVPDEIEVKVGWRAWGIPMNEDAPARLHSVTYSETIWQPRQKVEATCDKRSACHVPGDSCRCGLYAAMTREHLFSMKYHEYDADKKGMFHVVGTVSLWGKIVEGTQGWRAQYGYPRELYVPYEAWKLAAPLAEAYGTPVRLANVLAQ